MISDVIFEQLLLLEHVLYGGEISADIVIDQLIFNLHKTCQRSMTCPFLW